MLMGGDPLPEQYQPMQGVQLTVGLADPAEADRVFQALAEDGTVNMPAAGNLLGAPLRRRRRSLRHLLADQLRGRCRSFSSSAFMSAMIFA